MQIVDCFVRQTGWIPSLVVVKAIPKAVPTF